MTLLGRIVGVLCSIAGIFFIAMIFVFLVLYITLDDDENQAYKKIVYIYQKRDQNDAFNTYIKSYITYKILKSMKGRTLDSIQHRNKFLVLRNKYYFSLLSDVNDHNSTIIHNFSKKVNDFWNDQSDEIFYILGSNIDAINDELKQAISLSEVNFQLNLLSGTLSFKCLNLMTFNSTIGYCFPLDSISQIQGKKLISSTMLKKTEENIINFNKNNTRNITKIDIKTQRKASHETINHQYKEYNHIVENLIDRDEVIGAGQFTSIKLNKTAFLKDENKLDNTYTGQEETVKNLKEEINSKKEKSVNANNEPSIFDEDDDFRGTLFKKAISSFNVTCFTKQLSNISHNSVKSIRQ